MPSKKKKKKQPHLQNNNGGGGSKDFHVDLPMQLLSMQIFSFPIKNIALLKCQLNSMADVFSKLLGLGEYNENVTIQTYLKRFNQSINQLNLFHTQQLNDLNINKENPKQLTENQIKLIQNYMHLQHDFFNNQKIFIDSFIPFYNATIKKLQQAANLGLIKQTSIPQTIDLLKEIGQYRLVIEANFNPPAANMALWKETADGIINNYLQGHTITSLKQQCQILQAKLTDSENSAAHLKQTFSEIQEENKKIQSEIKQESDDLISKLQNEINSWTTKYNNLLTENEKANQHFLDAQQTQFSHAEQIQSLVTENNNLKTQIKHLQSELGRKANESVFFFETYGNKLEASQLSLEKSNKDLLAARQNNMSLQNQIEDLQAQIKELTNTNNQLKNDIKSQQDQIQAQHEASGKLVATHTREVNSLHDMNDRLKNEANEATADLSDLRTKHKQLNEYCEGLEYMIDDLDAQLNQMTSQMQILTQQHESILTENSQLKQQSSALNRQRLMAGSPASYYLVPAYAARGAPAL